jgi:hypothetical protein
MIRRHAIMIFAGLVVCGGALYGFQKPFREYPGQEYNDFPLPADYRDKTEFVFARLMYPDANGSFGFRRRFADWRKAIQTGPTITSDLTGT